MTIRSMWRIHTACGDWRAIRALTATPPFSRRLMPWDGRAGIALAILPLPLMAQVFSWRFGSIGNIADEPSPHATIQQFTIDGKPVKTYASGLAQPCGLGV